LNLFAALLIQFADMARVELEIAPIECVLRWNASEQIVRGRNSTNLLFFCSRADDQRLTGSKWENRFFLI
jgi:hypothetical protein